MKKLLRNLSVLCLVIAAALATGCYHEELPFLNVDHEVVLVGPQTDKGTVVVESNVDWEASSNDPWITLDHGFGNHKGTFEFFVEANTTPNERSGKIIIEGNGCSKTILIRQQSEGSKVTLAADNISFTKYAGEYLMSVACNGEWEVASSADWCKVDPTSGKGNGSFKVTVDENNTGADRVAKISVLTTADGVTQVRTVEVFQSASNAALVVSPEGKELTAAASSFELDVITTGSWEASLDSDWLTLSESAGNGDAKITVSARANETGAPRVAVITFASGAENENRVIRQIVVKQAAVDFYLVVPVIDYPLSLEECVIEIPYAVEGSNVTVNATSNVDWMKVNSVEGGIATVAVSENKTAQAREGIITFMTAGQEGEPIVRQVRVAQAPTVNVLDVLADEYAIEWTGATVRVPIYTNTPVSVRSSESWCNVVSDGQDVVITVPKNETAVPRTAVVTVMTNSDSGEILSKTTIVRQAAAYSALVVSPESKNIYALAQSFVASIVTNNSWTASSDSQWLTIDKKEGTGDYMLTVTAAENKTGQARTAVITVQTGIENSQRESATITVVQRPEQFYFEVPTRSYLIGVYGAIIDIPYVTSGNEQSVDASANVDWLKVGDVADGVAKVTVTENKTAEVRTGVVTITCTPVFGDPVSINVTFTQAPTVNILDVFVDKLDASAKGDEFALPYYANTPVSVSSSEDWVHAEVTVDEDSYEAECCSYSDPQKIIKIEVDPNRTGEARVAYVTISTVNDAGEKITKVITIRQAALYAALSVTPKEVVIPATETEFAMTINTTGTWWATNSSNWLTTSDEGDASTEAAGFGDAVINWTAAENTTGYDRRAQITVATGPENNEREEQVVTVIQLARDTYIEIPIAAYAVTKEEQTLEVGYYAAGDFTDMQVNCSEDWIKYTGGDATALEFDIEENTTAEPRTAIVTVTLQLKAGEPISDTFIVTQAPTINILDVYVDYYEASPKGEVVVFPFYGNTEVSTSVSSMVGGWCSVIPGTPNQDVDPQEIAIDVKKNESAEARTAYVTLTTVTDKGEKLTHIITIHQNPLNAMLSVSPEKVILPAHDAQFDLTVITTETWEATVDCTWLDADQLAGNGDYLITWTAGDNDLGVNREATITIFTGDENETRVAKTVQVIQLPYDTYLEIPQDSYFVGKEGFSGLDGEYFDVTCIAAGSWKDIYVDVNGASWLTYTDFDFDHLEFMVAENTTGAPRTATVTVTLDMVTGEPITDTFTVTQAGTYNMLDALADYITVSPDGETVTLPAVTNVDQLDVLISEPWLSASTVVDPASENPNSKMAAVGITAEANTTGRDRLASVTVSTVTDKGQTIAKKILVFQAAADQNFAILSGDNMFVNKAESSIDIVAYASVNADKVTMKSDSPWLTADGEPAVDETIVTGTFKASVNNSGAPRVATVTVTFFEENGATVQKTVTVYQSATDGGELEALVDQIVVAAEGETLDLTFETEDPLTATPSATWLTATIDNTTDPQKLTIEAAENTTGKARTAYITVSNGSESVVISVYQPAKGQEFAVLSPDIVQISKAETTVALSAYANVRPAQITMVSGADWLTYDSQIVFGNIMFQMFKATQNNSGADRAAIVKVSWVDEKGATQSGNIMVVQSASDGGKLATLVDYLTVATEGEDVKLTFETEDALTATPSADWITTAIDNSTDPQVLTITAAENATGKDRTAYVTVSNGSESVLITVFQPAKATEIALLTPETINVDSKEQDITVAVYNNANAESTTVVPGASWITFKEEGLFGPEMEIQTFTVAKNTSGAVRTAPLKVTTLDKSGKSYEYEVMVIQAPATLEPVVDYITADPAGDMQIVQFTYTGQLAVAMGTASWLSSSIATSWSEGYGFVTINAEPNNTGRDRTSSVQILSDDVVIAVVTVFQPAKSASEASAYFALLSGDVVYVPTAETVVDITAYASVNADKVKMISDSPAWLTEETAPAVDASDATIVAAQFKAAQNTSGAERTGSVKITYFDDMGAQVQKTVTVVQAAPSIKPVVDYIVADPAGDSQIVQFNYTGNLAVAAGTASWLSGSIATSWSPGYGFVTIDAKPNTTGRDRTSTVQILSDDVVIAAITVFQPANVPAAAAEFTLLTPNRAITSVAQDVPLRVYSSEEFADVADLKCSPVAEWLSIGTKALAGDNHIVKVPVKAQANTTGAPRTGVVDFTWIDAAGKSHVAQATIIQSASENILDVYVNTIQVPSPATEEYLPIYDNATSVVPKSSNSARVTPSIITNTDTGTRDVKLTIPENTTGETLTTYVTISAKFADGTTAEKVIAVVQTPAGADVPVGYILNLALENVSFTSAAGTQEIGVETNATSYTVASDAAWLTASVGSVILEAEENITADAREAHVTVTATFEDGTVIEKVMTVTQEAAAEPEPPVVFNVTATDPDEVGIEGADVEVSYVANKTVASVVSDNITDFPWITGFDSSSNPLKFNVGPNSDSEPRTADITFIFTDEDGNKVAVSVTIKQSATGGSVEPVVYEFNPDPSVNIDNQERTFQYPYTATETPLTTASVEILTSPLPEWIAPTENALEFKVTYNDTGADRSATISVKYTAPDATTITKDLVINQSMGLF